ncbi:MAG TPA: pantoate--beta-alanine ligase [Sphingobacteriaceae bacterium]
MKLFTTARDLTQYLDQERAVGKKIGFVPTMGALHAGHLSLIDLARERSEIVVASIFVNPTQFNDPADLEKYPRPKEQDIEKLTRAQCDVLFMPEVREMYTEPNEHWHLDLKGLDGILEGKSRTGHYQGVTQIVKKLFDLVDPDFAFFGQKDYQQFRVVEQMVNHFQLKTQLVMCPIIREADGLAMSSRNVHLSPEEHQNALALSRVLHQAQADFADKSLMEIREEAIRQLTSSPGIDLQYFEICDGATLLPVDTKDARSIVALVAARVGQTRLIDNIILK